MSETTTRNGSERNKPIAIYYEQPNWFVPLFKEMDARGVNWIKLDARYHQYYAASPEREYSLLERLGLPNPKARVINHASQAVSAGDAVGYPLIVKTNIGGSAARIKRF